MKTKFSLASVLSVLALGTADALFFQRATGNVFFTLSND